MSSTFGIRSMLIILASLGRIRSRREAWWVVYARKRREFNENDGQIPLPKPWHFSGLLRRNLSSKQQPPLWTIQIDACAQRV
jgi:hypothetical protein